MWKTITVSVEVVKFTLLSWENMQVFETLRVGVLPNWSLTVMCTYAQNNI
jgi:hypothetical protein